MEIKDLSNSQKTDLANAIAMSNVTETTESSFSLIFSQLGITVPNKWSFTEVENGDENDERQLELYEQAEQLVTDIECLKYEVLMEINNKEAIEELKVSADQIWDDFEDLKESDDWEDFIAGAQQM